VVKYGLWRRHHTTLIIGFRKGGWQFFRNPLNRVLFNTREEGERFIETVVAREIGRQFVHQFSVKQYIPKKDKHAKVRNQIRH
jgi:hypothetical protein